MEWFEQSKKELGLVLPSLSESLKTKPLDDHEDRSIALTVREIVNSVTPQLAPSALQKRIDWVGEVLKLDASEVMALGAVCRLTQFQPFITFATVVTDSFSDDDEVKASLIGSVLGFRNAILHHIFSCNGQLLSLGLLEDRRGGDYAPSELLLNLLRERTTDPNVLMTLLVGTAPEPALCLSDFDHMASHVDDVTSILKGSLDQQIKGSNLLFYGAPGTGKTEFARLLGVLCDAKVIFAGELPQSQNEPTRSDRIAHLSLMSVLGSRTGRVIVVVDEAEDVLADVGLFTDGRRGGSKVFLNRMIENSSIPTIWITNRPESLDEAVIRRMIRAIEFCNPNQQARKRIIEQHATAYGLDIDVGSVARLAQISAAPAVIVSSIRAAKVGQGGADMAIAAALSLQKAMGKIEPVPALPSVVTFDASLSSADIDLCDLETMVLQSNSRALSFLFTGVPGSGKTAFARHLAQQLNMEVLEKRASDLLGKYVGETERLIATAFAQAIEGNYFLIFDEADSLLSDRTGAFHSWEISQVNEMLTWMERHPLPFAATSNLAGRLDPAIYRRFLFKARFEALNPCQIKIAFQQFFNDEAPVALLGLEHLTPGDFAVVKRQASISGICDREELAVLLEREALLKPGTNRSIGFR